jgi:hypothetical protein
LLVCLLSSLVSLTVSLSARRLAQEEQQTGLRLPSGQFALDPGHATAVRLQHAVSKRQIGEVVMAHNAADQMYFELVSIKGKYLKAKSNGVVGKESTLRMEWCAHSLNTLTLSLTHSTHSLSLSLTQHTHSTHIISLSLTHSLSLYHSLTLCVRESV